jgi:UDP-N-acetyl-D-galactosamine dehydrogenase
MGIFVANKVIKLMIANELIIKGGNVLILGITFKENCPDVRNTRVIDIYNELKLFGLNCDVYDPWASSIEVNAEYNIDLLGTINFEKKYEAVIITVAHDEFLHINYNLFKQNSTVIFDIKSIIDRKIVDGRL